MSDELEVFDTIEISGVVPDVEIIEEKKPSTSTDVEDTLEVVEEPIEEVKKDVIEKKKKKGNPYVEKVRALERMVQTQDEEVESAKQRAHRAELEKAELLKRLVDLEKNTATSTKASLTSSLDSLTDLYQQALEAGDTKRVAELQRKMMQVTMDVAAAERIASMPVTPPSPSPSPTPNIPIAAKQWLETRNFKNWDKEDKAIVDGVATKLIKKGMDAGTAPFYTELDKQLKRILPEHYNEEDEDDEVEMEEEKPVAKKVSNTAGAVSTPARGGIKREGNKLKISKAELERIKSSMRLVKFGNPNDPASILEFIKYQEDN